MSPRIRPAVENDADQVVEHLYTHMSSKISRQYWGRLFDYPWKPDDVRDFGRVVDDGGRIVGYLGGNYSDRLINGHCERLCNLSSAYLLKEYRGQGLGKEMYADLGLDDGVTYTSFTSTMMVQGMMLGGLGYDILDDRRYMISKKTQAAASVKWSDDTDLLDRLFPGEGQKLRRHNEPLGVRFLAMEAGNQNCLLALHIKKKGDDISYHEVLHVSDTALLTRCAEDLANSLLPDEKSVLAIDHRFMPGYDGAAPSEEIPLPRIFKSSRLGGHDIDNLNNEVMMFDQKFP